MRGHSGAKPLVAIIGQSPGQMTTTSILPGEMVGGGVTRRPNKAWGYQGSVATNQIMRVRIFGTDLANPMGLFQLTAFCICGCPPGQALPITLKHGYISQLIKALPGDRVRGIMPSPR